MTTMRLLDDYPGYGIDDLGVVYSWRLYSEVDYTRQPKTRVGSVDSSGYRSVSMQVNGRPVTKRIHELVLLAFVGPRPEGCECRHRDGNRLNNCIANLEYGTRRENIHDKYRHGTQTKGQDHHTAKLRECDVLSIRRRAGRVPQHALAAEFGLRPSTISAIVRRKIWTHI